MKWDEFFINLAKSVSLKSKDPSTKVGSVIVDEEDRVVSTGYNGFIKGCDESQLSWERPFKYFQVIHAEMNALLFAKRDLKNCKIYITDMPCDNCLKHVIQAGIKEIHYDKPDIMKNRGTRDQKEAIKVMINSTGTKVININNNKSAIEELEEEQDETIS
jgi:dCMP deaminase